MLDKEIIKKNFSKFARYYDTYATVQNRAALKLIEKLKSGSAGKVLDIGCGTGNYTRLLREKFPDARIKALDISKEMISVAKNKLSNKGVEFIVADAETEEFNEDFDLIGSNATFQWFADLEKMLCKFKKLLKKEGIILFSMFGPETFCELNISLKELLGSSTAITSYGFIGKDALDEVVKKYYRNVTIESENIEENYGSLIELLNKIKYTGTRGEGVTGRKLWTSRMIKELEKIYKKKFGGLVATSQLIYCRGMK